MADEPTAPHLSVEALDGLVTMTVDTTTANYLRYAIAVLGEHIAAGMEVPPMSSDMANRLGGFLDALEERLRAI